MYGWMGGGDKFAAAGKKVEGEETLLESPVAFLLYGTIHKQCELHLFVRCLFNFIDLHCVHSYGVLFFILYACGARFSVAVHLLPRLIG